MTTDRRRDELVRRGDFLVRKSAIEDAEDSFEQRSERSRAVDRAIRGPIVSDVEFWKKHQRRVDFPGVDTPTENPRQTVADFIGPKDRARMASGRPMGDVEPADPDPDLSLGDAIMEDLEMSDRQVDRGRDLLKGDRT